MPKTFGPYELSDGSSLHGWERYRYEDEYGVCISVVRHGQYSYGGSRGLWEALDCSMEPLTKDDVDSEPVGWLSEEAVASYITDIRRKRAVSTLRAVADALADRVDPAMVSEYATEDIDTIWRQLYQHAADAKTAPWGE